MDSFVAFLTFLLFVNIIYESLCINLIRLYVICHFFTILLQIAKYSLPFSWKCLIVKAYTFV